MNRAEEVIKKTDRKKRRTGRTTKRRRIRTEGKSSELIQLTSARWKLLLHKTQTEC